ncbi:MAG: hypothetical protein IPH12_16375 [Saprospirales bacterium]|nr:hypothetical protein [Saprospirales bacterium]
MVRSDIRIDKKFINKRKSLGHDLWDAPLFALVEIQEAEKKVELKIGLCTYFQYVSSCEKIGEESINNKRKLRDKFLPDIETVSKCPLNAHGIGVAFVIAVKEGDTYRILLQKRGMSTVNHLGTIASVPTFAFQPIKEDYENEINIEYQFLREYYEELHDREDLIKRNKNLAYNWFYNHNPIKRIRDLMAKELFEIVPLGFGFDALNGEAILAYLAIIDDEDFGKMRRRKSYLIGKLIMYWINRLMMVIWKIF